MLGLLLATSQETKPVTPFVREATGLVKNVGFLDAISFNLANMSVGSALAIVGFTMVLLPSVSGVNLVYGSIIAFVLMIPQIVVYTLMQIEIPRTGGDYVWATRSLGRFAGIFTFAGFVTSPFSYVAIISLATVFTIGSVGLFFGNQSFLSLAVPGSDPLLQFVVAAVVILAAVGILTRPNLGYKVLSALMIIGIVTILLAVVTLLSAGTPGVKSYMDYLNSIGANATYSSVANSYSGGSFNFNSTLIMIPFFMIFLYPYINGSPSVGSELKGKSATRWSIPVASLLTFALATLPFATLYYVAGMPFTNAAFSNPNLVFDYSLNFWTLAMGVSPNQIIAAIIGLGSIVWGVAIIVMVSAMFSRYVLAQAFDRFLPEKLAYVNKRGAPSYSLLLVLIGSLVLVSLTAYFYGTLSSLSSAIAVTIIYFFVVALSVGIYGMKKAKGRLRNALVIFAALDAIVMLYILYAFFANPGPSVYGGNALSYGYIGVSFLIGVVIYFWTKSYYSKKGIDVNLAYKEIPAE